LPYIRPGDRKVTVGAMNARIVLVVEFRFIEPKENIHLITRPLLGLIDLVALHEGMREMTRRFG